jgi:hypothetical protein
MRNNLKIVGACAATAIAVGATSAGAASLMTGAQVKDNSLTGLDIKNIRSGDVKDGSIRLRDFSSEVRSAINSGNANTGSSAGANGATGAPGANGTNGGNGTPGTPGTPGAAGAPGRDATVSSGNWGVIARNTIGSPDIFMRSGPGTTPRGTGSLGFSVADDGTPAGLEKAAYGNEKDFAGNAVSGLNALGFAVFTTGENAALGTPNMPSIAIEVDPNLTASPSNFSTLVFVPNNTTPNQWTSIDATDPAAGFWFLTGAAGPATNCNQTTTCTFAQAKTALAQGTGATIYTVGVTKGRDHAWQGAIDALRINTQVFDFEETGVKTGTP